MVNIQSWTAGEMHSKILTFWMVACLINQILGTEGGVVVNGPNVRSVDAEWNISDVEDQNSAPEYTDVQRRQDEPTADEIASVAAGILTEIEDGELGPSDVAELVDTLEEDDAAKSKRELDQEVAAESNENLDQEVADPSGLSEEDVEEGRRLLMLARALSLSRREAPGLTSDGNLKLNKRGWGKVKSWFKKTGKKIKHRAKTIGKAFKDAAKKTGKKIKHRWSRLHFWG